MWYGKYDNYVYDDPPKVQTCRCEEDRGPAPIHADLALELWHGGEASPSELMTYARYLNEGRECLSTHGSQGTPGELPPPLQEGEVHRNPHRP